MPDELRCPSCGLLSPPETEYCDCGYDLSGQGRPKQQPDDRQLSRSDEGVAESSFWDDEVHWSVNDIAVVTLKLFAWSSLIGGTILAVMTWAGEGGPLSLIIKNYHEFKLLAGASVFLSGLLWWALLIVVSSLGQAQLAEQMENGEE